MLSSLDSLPPPPVGCEQCYTCKTARPQKAETASAATPLTERDETMLQQMERTGLGGINGTPVEYRCLDGKFAKFSNGSLVPNG